MRPQSCKSKGRRFQQKVRDYLLQEFAEILQADDIRSTSMGASGDDLILSPLAQVMLPFAFEMKNVESPAVGATLRQAQARQTNNAMPVCVFSRNKVKLPDALTIVPLTLFLRLFGAQQFTYDFAQHKLIPVIVDLHHPALWLLSSCDDMGVEWTLHTHMPNSFNLWLKWAEYKQQSPGGTGPMAVQIFGQDAELGAHMVLPFGHFVRLVKNLWLKSTARAHLLRIPSQGKEEQEKEQEKQRESPECILME